MRDKILKVTTRVITTVLSIIMVLLMLLAAYNFFSVKILKQDYSNVFGYTMFEVISGSMEPAIDKWDVILVEVGGDYKKGDIVSFKSEGAFVTHRVVEVKGDTYITKGDTNNTVDKPLTKDMIVGKVVRVFKGVGIWIKVLTTPKVIAASIITIVLMFYTIKLLKKKEQEEVKKIKEEKIESRSEIMEKLKNNNKLKIELCIFMILLALLIFLVPYTLSRFKTEARSTADMDIAFFAAKDTYTRTNINLDDMEPGDVKEYTFSVSNTDGEHRTEVSLSYFVEIKATTNLPLDYELYLINSGIDTPIVSEEEIISDDDGTYFKTLKTSSRFFDINNDYTDSYKLVITFPNEYVDHSYQGVAENVEITVNAKQILDSDN